MGGIYGGKMSWNKTMMIGLKGVADGLSGLSYTERLEMGDDCTAVREKGEGHWANGAERRRFAIGHNNMCLRL